MLLCAGVTVFCFSLSGLALRVFVRGFCYRQLGKMRNAAARQIAVWAAGKPPDNPGGFPAAMLTLGGFATARSVYFADYVEGDRQTNVR